MDKMLAMEREPSATSADHDRFAALFSAHYAKVVAIARRVLSDDHLAEDVAQEVFASCYRNGKAVDSAHTARWLHSAAVHTSLNVLRGNRRRAERETRDGRARALDESVVSVADPQAIVELRERRAEVRAALKRLSPKYAAVLVLRHAGLSYAEIAAALDAGINTVGTLLARAEAAFKKEIIRVSPR